jgi:hypothetical protein
LKTFNGSQFKLIQLMHLRLKNIVLHTILEISQEQIKIHRELQMNQSNQILQNNLPKSISTWLNYITKDNCKEVKLVNVFNKNLEAQRR